MGVAVKLNAKRFCGLVVVGVSLISIAVLPFQSFSGRIDAMLPEKEGIKDIFSFLKDVQVTDKVLVTLSTRDGSVGSDILCSAAAQYVAKLDPKLAFPMNTAFQQGEIVQDFKRLVRQLPDYTVASEFEELSAATSAAGVSTSLSNLVKRLQTPEGMFSGSSAQSDPLDWNGRMIKKMLGMLTSFGYRAVPVQGRLMDPEHKHLLLVLQTPIGMMDVPGARALVAHLEDCAKALPPAVEARLVCAHLHTLGNETIIRRDIMVTSISAVLVFCILFFVVYRDWRAGYMVLLPLLASLPALAVSAFIFKGFSAFVVGLGATITGITDDYSVHAYVYSRTEQREQNLKRIRLPVILSALTTLCLFIAFCFSSIPAYRQLGCFASLSVLVAVIYALVVLPHFIPVVKKTPRAEEPTAETLSRHLLKPCIAWLVIGCSVVAFVLGLVGLKFLKFDANVSKLDGTPSAVIAEEQRAIQLWGGGESHSAILSVEAPTEETALRLNDELYATLLKTGLAAHEVSSLAPLFPSEATRQQRRKQWISYWSPERVQAFRENIKKGSAELEFSDDAFGSFWALFETWRVSETKASEPIGFLQPLRERFIHASQAIDNIPKTVWVTTFVADDPRVLDIAERVKKDIPSLKIVSRQAFSKQLSSAFWNEVLFVSKLAGVFIILVTVIVIRRPTMIALAMLPPIAGVIWGCAAMVYLGRSLDVSNLIAGIMVLGLCIDYGICMVFAYRDGIQGNSFRALTLSAVTTIMGAGVLLLAKHPALFSIGVTLVAGISAGYLCSLLTLRAIYSLARPEAKHD
jgi:predicted exporter